MTNTNNHENVIETATDELRCDLCHKDLGRPVASSCELSKRSWLMLGAMVGNGIGFARVCSRCRPVFACGEYANTARQKQIARCAGRV